MTDNTAALREFVEKVSKQTAEKPDYWSSCGQCSNNASEAEDLLEALAASPPVQQEPATFDLTNAREIVVSAIRRMRAAHVPCADLIMQTENFLEATRTAAKSDELWVQTLQDRDRYHETADKLAQAIAHHFNAEIGEHSSANCPWGQALEVIATQPQEVARKPLTNERIEKMAIRHESFGFGLADSHAPSTHGFDPEGLIAFVREIEGGTPSEAKGG